MKRVEYTAVTDDEALDAFFMLTQKEGIIPALETAHALAYSFQLSKKTQKNKKFCLIYLDEVIKISIQLQN